MANKLYYLRPVSAATNTPDAGDGMVQLMPITITGMADAAGLSVDPSDHIYIADQQNHVIFKWRRGDNTSYVFAGSLGNSGLADGQGANARFNTPTSIACDRSGVLWVVDLGNERIRRIDQNGNVSTVATIPAPVSANVVIAVDSADKIYLVDEA